MQSKYESIKILSKECLISFGANGDCLDTIIVWNVNGHAVQEYSLIPHQQEKVFFRHDQEVPESYKIAAIEVLEEWVKEGLFLSESQNDFFDRYWPNGRGYAYVPKTFGDITAVDLCRDFIETGCFWDVMNHECPEYFTAEHRSYFPQLLGTYLNDNSIYIQKKAQEFADFWTQQLNSDCDKTINSLHSKLLEYAENKLLVERRIPHWNTYFSCNQIEVFLQHNNLSELLPLFPVGIGDKLNFDDRPQLGAAK